ncbi:MAG TPA: ABC transporter substrate-binding protein, partial [Exiguobacterium sp.]|nr:ABC transporter substrate-binding protein [Exiguobacterium sp.]
MKFKKTKLVAAASVLTLSAFLAACGGEDEQQTKTKDGKTIVTWWGWAPQPEAGKTVVDAFNKSQDKYVVQFKRYSEDYEKQLQVAMLSGKGPDIIGLKEPMIQQYKDRVVPVDV